MKFLIVLLALFPVVAPAQSLSERVVSYLSAASIPWAPGDWSTCQPEGQPDQICSWDAGKLGPQPSAGALAATPVSPPVPAQITAVQLQRQLNAMASCAPDGKTNCYAAAASAISASGNVDLQIQWAKATVFLRGDPNVAAIGAAIGLTSAQIDQTFRDAVANYP